MGILHISRLWVSNIQLQSKRHLAMLHTTGKTVVVSHSCRTWPSWQGAVGQGSDSFNPLMPQWMCEQGGETLGECNTAALLSDHHQCRAEHTMRHICLLLHSHRNPRLLQQNLSSGSLSPHPENPPHRHTHCMLFTSSLFAKFLVFYQPIQAPQALYLGF